VTYDTVRAGGIEQLQAFTRLLGIPLKKVAAPEDLPGVLDDMGPYDQIFIDSPGVNSFNRDDMRGLAKLVSRTDVEPHLVFPAGVVPEEAQEVASAFAHVGIQSMIATRLDLSRRMGSLLAAANTGRFAFSEASNTQKVADGLFSLTPKSLSQLLMPSASTKLIEDQYEEAFY